MGALSVLFRENTHELEVSGQGILRLAAFTALLGGHSCFLLSFWLATRVLFARLLLLLLGLLVEILFCVLLLHLKVLLG